MYYFQRKDQSGFFFIDNIFYNDMRNSANEDYSKWASINLSDHMISVEGLS